MARKKPILTLSLLSVFAIISYSPLSSWLEQSMLRHVLVQLPALTLLGYWAAKLFFRDLKFIDKINEKGVFGIILVIALAFFWMLPRSLDAAVHNPAMAFAKYLSVPLLIGAPLALSWGKLHPIFRGLVHVELITMLIRLGWLYMASPIRLCNSYLLEEQILLGQCLLAIAAVLSLYWLLKLFGIGAPVRWAHRTE